jgi:hypothetical protein
MATRDFSPHEAYTPADEAARLDRIADPALQEGHQEIYPPSRHRQMLVRATDGQEWVIKLDFPFPEHQTTHVCKRPGSPSHADWITVEIVRFF